MLDMHDETNRKEKEMVFKKKSLYLDLITKIQNEYEKQEGEALMNFQSSGLTTQKDEQSLQLLKEAQNLVSFENKPNTILERKKALWKVINEDKVEDPFRTVHQARVDARKAHDRSYAKMPGIDLAIEPHNWNRTWGYYRAGLGQERFVLLDKPSKTMGHYVWGQSDQQKFNYDDDGTKQYKLDQYRPSQAILDKNEDIDLRFYNKEGRQISAGPRYYKRGVTDDVAPFADLSPFGPKRRRTSQQTSSTK
jgi:hypothetical protein